MNGSKHQRRSHRAKAHVWANGAHERMVQYARQNGQPLARGSANWMQMLQYMAFVALKGGRGLCYMSVERIAGHAANTDRTVQRMTALAEASGVLILVEAGGRRRGNRRRANCWRINPQCMSAPPPRRSSRTEEGQLVAQCEENGVAPKESRGDTFVGADPPTGVVDPDGGVIHASPPVLESSDEDEMTGPELFAWFDAHQRSRFRRR